MAYRFKHGDRPLDDYTIQRAVGSGGFGEVYYSVSDGGREVALKYLHQNPESELRGVSHCINLKSPHLVSIFDVKKNADGDYFIIMEYCSGPSLRDLLIAEPNGFAPEKAVFFVREIAKGLAYLHDRGIVHRDLKPGNLFYDDGYVKIGDYGLSKFISVSRHSAQTASVGTVHYMAPEIGSGDYSRSVDIYALGVILYEMLLGKVPFEGSSMAEILMKHLTSQPEVEALPEPFAKVIRKALEKDPKDRYQTVDELVDDLLSVEDVKKSLAGFSPQSLEGAVRMGGQAGAQSPIPSPNPRPRQAYRATVPPLDIRAGLGALPKRAAKRLERVGRKIEKRVAKLGGAPEAVVIGVGIGPATHHAARAGSPGAGGRARKMLPALLLTVGIVVGTGVIFGSQFTEEVGVGVGLTVITLSAGVAMSRTASRRLAGEEGPRWAGAVVRVCLCAPLAFLGMAPLLDSSEWGEVGLAVAVALTVVALLFDWARTIREGAAGEMGVGRAIWGGFGAAILGAVFGGIFDVRAPEHVFWIAGAITAAASMVVQANAWWLAGGGRRRVPITVPGSFGATVAAGQDIGGDPAHAVQRDHPAMGNEGNPPFAVPVGDMHGGGAGHRTTAASQAHWNWPARRQRSLFARGFWSIAAFLCLGASLVGFVVPLVSQDLTADAQTAAIMVCMGGAALLIFALCKTTMRKRDGFWRESLRPFMICAFLFAIGGTITGIARHWNDVPDEGRVALVSGLVLSSLLFLFQLLFTGRRKRTAKPVQTATAPADPAPAGQQQATASEAAGVNANNA